MGFPERLEKAIALSGKSQTQLARETGIAQPSISAMTRGEQKPYLQQAIDLARATGVGVAWLADEPEGAGALGEDERTILKLYRAMRISEDDALQRLADPIEAAERLRVVAIKDRTPLYRDLLRQIEEEREVRGKRGGNGGASGR